MIKFKIKKLSIFLGAFVVTIFATFVFNVFADTTSSLIPNADGGEDSASWLNTTATACNAADCYLEVDEIAGAECSDSDGDTSYIYSNGADVSQTFDIDESSIPDGASITNIDVTACYFKEGSNGGTFQTRYCFDGACTSSGVNLSTGNSYAEATQSFSVSHTKASGSDIEIGVIDTSAGKDVRISKLKTVITYTPVDTTPPATTSDLTASGPTTSTIDLDWTAPGDDGTSGTATTYDIRYSTATINDGNWASATPVSPSEPTPSVAGTAESMTVTGLSADTTYYFAMKASDEVPNESALSNVTSETTSAAGDTTPPSAVADLDASNVGQTNVNLSWTAPGDDGTSGTATTYDVRYSTSAINDGNWGSATQATGEPSPSVAGSSESFNVTGLSASTLYYFAIKTSDEVPNESALSNVYSTTTTATPDTTPPATTSDLAASGPTSTTIDLDWTAPGDDGTSGTATTYDIRYSTATINDGNWASATPVSPSEPTPSAAGTAESMTVTGLSPSTLYYFAMKTSDEVPNESALSNVTSETTSAAGDTTPPATTSDLTASGPTSTTIDLDWTAPGDDGSSGTATTYDIRYSTATINDSNWDSAINVLGEPSPSVAGTAESMTVTGLNSDTTYYFAMKTLDETPNESALSNVTNETTLEGPSITVPDVGGGSAATKIRFSGQAFPRSQILVSMVNDVNPYFQNTPIVINRITENGEFYIDYTALLTGKYFITLKAVDKDEHETGIMSFRVDFNSEQSLVVENILMSPTVNIKRGSMNLDDMLTVFGYSAASSTVELSLDGTHKFETVAGDDGYYLFEIPVVEIGEGIYFAKVKQNWNNRTSTYSYPITFKVSGLVSTNTDLNEDKVIDIIDWSIFLFRWGSENNPLLDSIDFDNNGIINISDFSIFLKSMSQI